MAVPASLLAPVLRYRLVTDQVTAMEIRHKTNLAVSLAGILIAIIFVPTLVILVMSQRWVFASLVTPIAMLGLRYGSTLATRQKLNRVGATIFVSGFVSREPGPGQRLARRFQGSNNEVVAFEVAERHEGYYQRRGARKVGKRLWVYVPDESRRDN